MLHSVLGKLRITGGNAMPTQVPAENEDREEDGFLLIGETPSDRSTITHQQFVSQQGINPPPEYSQVTAAGPPDYQTAFAMNMTELSPFGASPIVANNNHMLPLSDVPFQLSPQLMLQQKLGSMAHLQGLERTALDLSKYQYDFKFELNYLQEVGSTCRNNDPPSSAKPNKDLIQF